MTKPKRSKARQKFLDLKEPSKECQYSNEERENWLNNLCNEFVQPSKANKAYYKVVVETLWPKGHGIPGPYVSEEEIRSAIDNFRKKNRFGKDPDKPYVDVFRRVRELQGEEGLTGVARKGKTFQLIDLKVGPKRVPRTKLSDSDWQNVKEKYGNKCPSCRKEEPQVRFQQDHKIPRTRGGGDGIENWQPLCDECNNFKSVSCRGCELDCNKCCWAFPEKFAPIILAPELLEKFYSYCNINKLEPSSFLSKLVIEKIGE